MDQFNIIWIRRTKTLFALVVLFFFMFFVSCDKDEDNPASSRTITCEAGCSSMSWAISGETGSVSFSETCNRTYNAYGNYSETCTGSKTYEQSGNTYYYTAIYDWINCTISVEVTGVGSCSDQANSNLSSKECGCDEINNLYEIVKYKDALE